MLKLIVCGVAVLALAAVMASRKEQLVLVQVQFVSAVVVTV
jgi:hypothetical protein